MLKINSKISIKLTRLTPIHKPSVPPTLAHKSVASMEEISLVFVYSMFL